MKCREAKHVINVWILCLSAATSISCDLDYKDGLTVQKFWLL